MSALHPASPPTAELPDSIAEAAERAAAGTERVVLTRQGRPMVALVSMEDMRTLEALEDRADAEEIRARLEEWRREATTPRAPEADAGPLVSLDDVARRLGITLDRSGA